MRHVELAGIIALVSAALAVKPAFGANPRVALAYQLTHSANMDPSFAPDGARMVYISVVAGKEQLFTARPDGTAAAQITRDDADHEDPAWSPDGRRIAFVRIADGQEIIEVMRPDGSGAETVTPAAQRAIHPRWSPDSSSLIYCTDDDLKPPAKNASEIYTVRLQGRRVVNLIAGGVNTYPAWSPDGRRIAFRRIVGDMNSEVFVADADGSGARNLTNHWAFDGWPAWSPDGSQIAFASNRAGNYQIWVMKPDGSGVRRVADTEGRATSPAWTPDGRRIYFTDCLRRDGGADCEIYVAEAPAA